jgi:hypothetical protein
LISCGFGDLRLGDLGLGDLNIGVFGIGDLTTGYEPSDEFLPSI